RLAGRYVSPGGGDDAAVLCEAPQHRWSGRSGGVGLAAPDDGLDPVLGGDNRADLVGEQVEVRLPVVDEADRTAGHRSMQRRNAHGVGGGHTDGTQDANLAHDVLRLTPVDRASSRPRLSCSSARTVRLISTVTDSTGSGLPSR